MKLAALLFLILIGCAHEADAPPPATQPAPANSAQPAQSPREAFAQFILSIMDGDSQSVGRLCVASDGDSKIIVSELQAMADATGDLRAAMNEKFGPGDSAAPYAFLTIDDVAALQQTISADSATLTGESVSEIRFKRVDGAWKIDVADLRDKALPANPHEYLMGMARAITRTASDVRSGRLTSGAVTREALEVRQMAVENGTATAPAN